MKKLHRSNTWVITHSGEEWTARTRNALSWRDWPSHATMSRWAGVRVSLDRSEFWPEGDRTVLVYREDR